MKKRMMAILVSLLMVFAMLPLSAGVAFAESDSTNPVIDLGSFKTTLPEGKDKVTVGDTVTMSMNVYDDSRVNVVYVEFIKPETGYIKSSMFEYQGTDSETKSGLWAQTFTIDNSTENGIWKVHFLRVEDTAGNVTVYYDSNIYPGTVERADLSGLTFEVYGTNPDTTGPQINLESMKVALPEGKSTVTAGDTVTMSMDVSDDSGVSVVLVEFLKPETGNHQYWMFEYKGADFETGNGTWAKTLEISDATENGEWKAHYIRIEDKAGNVTVYNDSNIHPGTYDGADLSGLTFEVCETQADTARPDINLESLKMTLPEGKDKITAGDTVTLSMDVSDDSGVKAAYIELQKPSGNSTQRIDLKYQGNDPETNNGVWAGTFTATDTTERGIWKANFMLAEDNSGNTTTYYDSTLYPGTDGRADLSNLTFEVISPDCPYDLTDAGYSMMLDGADASATFGGVYYVDDLSGAVTPAVKVRFDAEDGSWTTLASRKYTLKYEKLTGSDTWQDYTAETFGVDEDGTATYRVSATGDESLYYKGTVGPVAFKVMIKAEEHQWEQKIDKATPYADGRIYMVCTECGAEEAIAPLPKVGTIKLAKTIYTYTGSCNKPAVIVANINEKLSDDVYAVKYTYNKSVGKASAKVTLKGDYYSGSKTLYFKINPKGTSVKYLTRASKAITVKWARQSTKMSTSRISGYQIRLATNSKFTTGVKTVTVKGYSTTSKKVTKLKGNKKYYVKVRTYKTVNGVRYYSAWSKSKATTTKR